MKTFTQIIRKNACRFAAAIIVLPQVLASCESLDDSIKSDPYGGGKQPLGIKLLSETPTPAQGYPGDTVVFKAEGLLAWCNPDAGEYQFKFYMGERETPVEAATDSTLTVVVPQNLSTGITYLVLQNQVFYGPTFPVLGNLTVDKDYGLYEYGTSSVVYDYLESKYASSAHNYYLVGDFSRIGKDNRFSGIGFIDERGNVAGKNTTHFGISSGLKYNSITDASYIHSISYFDDGQMLISGTFTAYESSNEKSDKLELGNQISVNNIAVLEKNALPDTVHYNFEENRNSEGKYTPVSLSAFNGGSKQSILRSYVTRSQQVIAVGNLVQHCTNQYARFYKESMEITTPVASVMRMSRTGELDRTYRNVAEGYTGAAGGNIADAYMDEEEGIVLVGDFTSFDGIAAPGIIRLDANGKVDRSFLSNIGTGPQGNISLVRYNKTLRKAMITGSFSSFNGQARQNIAMLNADGILDSSFVPRLFEGGAPNFAALVDKQKIIVSGTFNRYDGIPRQGFLVLDMDGAATQRFNVPGIFSGQLQQVIETETTIGSYGLLLLGDFYRFNGELVNNVLMLEANFDDE